MYVFSIPLDGGECQLIKKHDLKNVDQQTIRQEQIASRPQESAPINITEN
jgi:hypothetical protein